MKTNKKNKNAGIFITLGAAAAMIALCVVLLNALLAHAAAPKEGDVQADPIVQNLEVEDPEAGAEENLDMVVYTQGRQAPQEAVTPQYAAAVTAEIAERVYNKPLKGRVFITLAEPFGAGQGLYWDVIAEAGGGSVSCMVQASTGVERISRFSANADDWAWFDSWDEDAAEAQRTEQAAIEAATSPDQQAEKNGGYSEEELARLLEMKKAGMLEFAAKVNSAPYEAKALELVNSLGIGDGANAVAAAVMMGDADPGDCSCYTIEVTLDDGGYVFVELTVDDMAVLGYERSEVSMAEKYYG